MRVLLAALAFACLSAKAADGWRQYSPKMIAHPLRAVGTNRVSLDPLFAWIRANGNQAGRDSATINDRRKNPMPQWRALKMRVTDVSDTGVFGYVFLIDRDFDRREQDGLVVLRNWPTKGIAEGDRIELVALEAGTEKVNGRTLRKYDGGLPYAAKLQL